MKTYKELPKTYRDKIEKEVDDLFDKVDKEYAESIKTWIAEPITSAYNKELDTMSLESIKYWIGLNKALNKRGTQQ
jgi:Leu/Phe-tRNA-protein transferase